MASPLIAGLWADAIAAGLTPKDLCSEARPTRRLNVVGLGRNGALSRTENSVVCSKNGQVMTLPNELSTPLLRPNFFTNMGQLLTTYLLEKKHLSGLP